MTPSLKSRELTMAYLLVCGDMVRAKECSKIHCNSMKQAINDLYYQLKPDIQVKAKFEEQVIFWEEVEMEIGRI